MPIGTTRVNGLDGKVDSEDVFNNKLTGQLTALGIRGTRQWSISDFSG